MKTHLHPSVVSVLLQNMFYNEPLSLPSPRVAGRGWKLGRYARRYRFLPSPRKTGRGWPQAGRGVRVKVLWNHYTGIAACAALLLVAAGARGGAAPSIPQPSDISFRKEVQHA